MTPRFRISPKPFLWDRRLLALMIMAAVAVAGRIWLAENPQHNPWVPLDLRNPPGWATAGKLTGLRDEPDICRAVLERSEVAFIVLPEAGEGACARPDRTVLRDYPFTPAAPPTTCPVAAGLHLWLEREVQPAAREILGSPVARIEHYGTYSCRRIYGGPTGRWSEHATGNAIDIAAFTLEDGRRVSVLSGWPDGGAGSEFLKAARDGACDIFGTVLSPDYNEAHRDHFHFDQQPRGFGGVCR